MYDQIQAGITVPCVSGIVLFGGVAVMDGRGRSASPTSLVSMGESGVGVAGSLARPPNAMHGLARRDHTISANDLLVGVSRPRTHLI